jgi:hypothetical protein
MRYHAAIVVFAVAIASGCDGAFGIGAPAIQGSGVGKKETRAVEAFHAIDARNAIQVTVAVQEGAKPSLRVGGDDNLVPLVESVVHEGTLILKIKDNTSITTKLPLVADVVLDRFDRVEASGAASVKAKAGPKVDRFTADASGAANISVEGLDSANAAASATGAAHVTLSGSAASLKVEVSGASDIAAESLAVDEAEVSMSGASHAVLRAKNRVAGDVSGASRLELRGRPEKNSVSTSGASQVSEKT